MQQGRWVSYIFRYRNNARCENAGFIKVQRIMCNKGDQARIQIGLRISKNKPCRCMVYLLYNQNQVKYLTDIMIKEKERDTIVTRIDLSWDRPLNEGLSFLSYDGLIFTTDDGEFLAGMWREYKLDTSTIRLSGNTIKETSPHTGSAVNMEELPKDAGDDKETPPSISSAAAEEGSGYEDVCMELLKTHPKLPLLADSQFIECVKIVPHDIGKLAISNWKLGVNSFLSRGFYNYKYIMLGRVRLDKNVAYVIGVPGVFTNKEKYLANMFGFSEFIPAKNTRMLTGNFGYWISEVLSE